MPCKECGYRVPDFYEDVNKIEKYQTMIFELYKKKPFPKAEVRRLKIKRDVILKRVWSGLEEIGYWIRREVLRDTSVPIEWRTGERLYGEENAEADKSKRGQNALREIFSNDEDSGCDTVF